MSIAKRWSPAVLLALVVLIGIGGCSSGARFVGQDQFGGTVAIPENSNSWPNHYRDEAEKLMKQKCPEGYTVVREEPVEVRHSHGAVSYWITFRSKSAPPLGMPAVIVPTAGRYVVPQPVVPGQPVMPPSGVVPIPTRVVTPPTPGGLPPEPLPVTRPN